MKRRNFVKSGLLVPAVAFSPSLIASSEKQMDGKPIHVGSGQDRFGKRIQIGKAVLDCKISGKDTNGHLYVFESSQNHREEGIPLHMHPDLDETFYVLEGNVKIKIGDEIYRLGHGDTILAPRNIPHGWVTNSATPSKILIIVQGAGKMENFFEELSKLKEFSPPIVSEIYNKHNMVLMGPPLEAD
ncbi:cupin domain-containing protein [Pararhodonellum marinum]|uniref:cupin domain-containing protein n=1 Tax=Pararhodonellum marinum TaxID=2755358 RepID=UPI00188FEE83|nr:cupin domain-containing protein [Pararhodonellum marinum]